MVKKPLLQIPIDEKMDSDFKKAQKELKIDNRAECGRTLLSYVLEGGISELRDRIIKSKLEREKAEVERDIEDLLAKKENMTKQLEKLGA